jgi:hypothetical protein
MILAFTWLFVAAGCCPASVQCLTLLMKVAAAGVPWHCYCRLLDASSKEPAAAMQVAQLVHCLVAGVSSAAGTGTGAAG